MLNPRLKRMLITREASDGCPLPGSAPATPPSQPHSLCTFPPQCLCLHLPLNPPLFPISKKLKLRVFHHMKPLPTGMSSFTQRTTPCCSTSIHATRGNILYIFPLVIWAWGFYLHKTESSKRTRSLLRGLDSQGIARGLATLWTDYTVKQILRHIVQC